MKPQPSIELADILDDFDEATKPVKDDVYLSLRCELTDYDESMMASADESSDRKSVVNLVTRISKLNTEDYEAFLRIVTRHSQNAIHPKTAKKIENTKERLKRAKKLSLPNCIVMGVFIASASQKKAEVLTSEVKHALSEQGHSTKDVSSGVNQMSKIDTPLISIFKKSSTSDEKKISLTNDGIYRLNELISPRI